MRSEGKELKNFRHKLFGEKIKKKRNEMLKKFFLEKIQKTKIKVTKKIRLGKVLLLIVTVIS